MKYWTDCKQRYCYVKEYKCVDFDVVFCGH